MCLPLSSGIVQVYKKAKGKSKKAKSKRGSAGFTLLIARKTFAQVLNDRNKGSRYVYKCREA
jgi:hypothetical protein